MSNDLMFPNQGGQLAVPDYLNNAFGDESNTQSATGTPQLSIRGKVFRVVKDGMEQVMTQYDDEAGENVPRRMIRVVVLNQGERGARAYYKEDYDSSNTSAPTCFSLDGKVPSASALEQQAATCASCPHSVKGSRVTPSGHQTTACSLQRRLAIVPAASLDFDPLLLRLATTSAWDPDTKNAENGWMAWQQYCDFLQAKGVRHTAQIVTAVKFDDTEFPKVLFRAERFLDQTEAQAVAPRIKEDAVLEILHGIGGDRGSADNVPKAPASAETEQSFGGSVDSEPKPQPQEPEPQPEPQQAAPEPKPEPAEKAEPKPEPAEKAEPKPEPTKKAEPKVDDDLGSALEDVLSGWE